MTMILLDREFSDEQLHLASDYVDLRNIAQKVWPRVLKNCKAVNLRLYHITLASLGGIETLSTPRSLTMEWAPKIESLVPIFQMSDLVELTVSDFSKLRDISGIEHLQKLHTLNFSGNRGALTPKLRIASIKPVTKLNNLRSFSLQNTKLEDDDVRCLAECKNLHSLSLSNQFERAQIAYLAKRLNPQLEAPLSSRSETNLKCECGQRKHMFIGRRMPFLCPQCHADRFRKLDEEFYRLVDQA